MTLENTIALALSGVSLIVSILVWRKSHRASIHHSSDEGLFEVSRIELEYPYLSDSEWIRNISERTDRSEVLRYNTFAAIVWNYLETVYKEYNGRWFGARTLRRSQFWGVFCYYARTHSRWLFSDNTQYYSEPGFLHLVGLLCKEQPLEPVHTVSFPLSGHRRK
jgi:hypothetical protein